MAPTPRQHEGNADAWFCREPGLALLHQIQREAIPELTRVFGQSGLYLRPCRALPEALSGNMLAQVLSLYRHEDHFRGALACGDEALPLASGSLSLVYALCVLETCPDPDALVGEIARVLKPGGVALLASLNPWGLARLRWALRGLRGIDPVRLGQQVVDNGLEIERQHWLGPVWAPTAGLELREPRGQGLFAGLRAAHLIVARRREPGMTPLRTGTPNMALRPGMTAG
ncbi:class I SAM-dependent methyltransferase [Arenimonas aestuarii]